jgi:hypothetical protein
VRKVLIALIAGTFLLMSQGFAVSASESANQVAERTKYQWPPELDLNKSASGTTGYYWLTNDTFAGRATEGEGMSFIRVAPDIQPFCESFTDPYCVELVQKEGANWWSNLVLNACTLDLGKYPCVDGVSLEVDGKTRSLLFEQHVAGPTWPADDSVKLPPGGRASIWRDSTDAQDIRYLVIVSGTLPRLDDLKKPGGELAILQNFQASIVRTRVITGNYSGVRRFKSAEGAPRISFGSAPYCDWVIEGSCGYKVDFLSGSRLQLSVNLPAHARGFLIGRMKSPQIQVSRTSADFVNLKVSAEPINVPYLKVVVPIGESTSEMRGHFNNPRKYYCISTDPTCKSGLVGGGTASSGETAFDYFELFEKALPDRAALMVPIWSFRNHLANLGRCWTSDVFQGLVSTNAAVYEGDPPKLINGELVYKVAGVHQESEGKTFRGTYDLNIPSTIGRCLYDLSDRPIKASVSVTNRDGDVSVETTSFIERDGWIRLSANGFTFSQPTIKVALSQDESAPTPTPTPSVSPTIKPVIEKKSITCVKGKKVKRVAAENPKCPKGFKKR